MPTIACVRDGNGQRVAGMANVAGVANCTPMLGAGSIKNATKKETRLYDLGAGRRVLKRHLKKTYFYDHDECAEEHLLGWQGQCCCDTISVCAISTSSNNGYAFIYPGRTQRL